MKHQRLRNRLNGLANGLSDEEAQTLRDLADADTAALSALARTTEGRAVAQGSVGRLLRIIAEAVERRVTTG
jgi:hypothetical protein